MSNDTPREVLDFWQKAGPAAWWKKNLKFDEQIIDKFSSLHERAETRKLDDWRKEAASCLALVLVLDQFSRNMFRGSAKSFAQDNYALELAKHADNEGYISSQTHDLYGFFHLPFMHSEVLEDQERCVALIRKSGNQDSLKSALEHEEIIRRFGRFPHRNSVLGRLTTDEEQAFLNAGGFSG